MIYLFFFANPPVLKGLW